MNLHLRFWREEIPLRIKGLYHRRWWPARIRMLEQEVKDYQRWLRQTEEALALMTPSD